MKKLLKILPVLMVVAMILLVASPVFATTIGGVSIDPSTNSANSVSGIGNNILGIIQVVGTVVAVGVLMVLGIKYMMGSAEEKAEYKKTLMPYIIGAAFVFAASAIAGIIFGFTNTLAQ